MADPTTFDARLTDAFERYLADAPTAVNAAAVAAAVAMPTRRPVRWVLVLAILLLTLALGGAALIGSGVIKLPVSLPGSWTATGTMTTARTFPTATRLLDGRVLVTGRRQRLSNPFPSAEIYDPATGTWSATGPMIQLRFHATATLLPDGRVLVAGGSIGGPNALASAELYDPATGAWSATGSLAEARSGHTATLLPGGRVLVAGGYVLVDGSSRPGGTLVSVELYDPATGTWTATGPLAQGRGDHSATLLPDGRVLVAGGRAVAADPSKAVRQLVSAELYNPATGTWSVTGLLAEARSDHTATLLPDGTVLVAGGSFGGPHALASAELYDPATGTWSASGPLAEARSGHTATLLPDGRVLVAGGSADSLLPDGSAAGGLLALASAELYDPIRRSWTAAARMDEGRVGLAAVLLEDATVLVAGGLTENSESASAELYDPAGLDEPASVGCPTDPLAACGGATPASTPAPSAVQTSAPTP
jgi:large repetitive protein